MKETDKFIIRICCEPQIKIVDDDEITSFTQKITTMRVKMIDEGIIGQLREIMRIEGITELFAIDESKVLQLVKEHKALDIIIEKEVNVSMFKSYLKCGVGLKDFTYQEYKKYNHTIFSKTKLTQEEYDLLREVML